MNIIDGKEIAKKLRSKIAEEVAILDRPPGLAVILVGEDPASAVYVRNKELACRQAGFFSDKIIKSENITEEQLLEEVERLNNNPHIDGILVQLPLPKHINANKVIEELIVKSYLENVSIINVITGKGSRSENKENPYISNDLSILKYSVPNYIINNPELMEIIKELDLNSIRDKNQGAFDIFLKKKL